MTSAGTRAAPARTAPAAAPARARTAPAPARTLRPPLVLVAHGSRDPRARATVRAIADRVCAVLGAADPLAVVPAFCDHGPPRAGRAIDALAGSGAREVVVLPLLLTAGYHGTADIPAELALARRDRPGLVIRYGRPLLPHPLLADALERRVREAGGAGPDTGIVLGAAGSADPAARAEVERLAAGWARRTSRPVAVAYATAAPADPASVTAAVARLRSAGAARVVVAACLLAPGLFADRLHRLADQAGADAVTPVLGTAPELTTILTHKYTQTLTRPPWPNPSSRAGGHRPPRER